jgi:tetratricopeptide (TPR) repeat protein
MTNIIKKFLVWCYTLRAMLILREKKFELDHIKSIRQQEKLMLKYPKAINLCDKAIKIAPNFYMGWNAKGFILSDKIYDLASLKADKTNKQRWKNLTEKNMWETYDKNQEIYIKYVKKSSFKEASLCYDMAIKLNPSDESSWLHKGNDLEAVGKFKEALICFNKVLELSPEYGLAKRQKKICLEKLDKK